MLLPLCACGGGSDGTSGGDVAQPAGAQTLALDQPNSVADRLDFTLVKIQTTNKIEASMSGGGYYENSAAGETYIDVVLDMTNRGTETVNSDDVLTAVAVNSSGTEFPCHLYAVETDQNSSISSYENIAPLATVRFHCGISVPESETALTIKLNINGEEYGCAYNMGDKVATVTPLPVGQSIDDEVFAKLQFQGVEYTGDLLPSNTSKSYSHYEVDSPDNVCLVAKFDVTNYQETAKEEDAFVSVKAVYMDKYTYTGFAVVEDTDGAGFGRYEDIDPLTTRHLFVLIEVPKVVTDKPADLQIYFNGTEYTYTHTAA